MKVGIIAIQHESNTFLSQPTELEDFERDVLLTGDAIRMKFAASHHELGGFFQGLSDHNIDAVPLFAARAVPSGRITAATCDDLVSMMLESLHRGGTFDGLLVAPHGAGVSEKHPDFDGYWLTRLREAVGSSLPMVCTLDLHANVSQAMVDACNATIAYRTNPHLDQRECGKLAADLLCAHLRAEVCLTQALVMPRIAINIERQLTSDEPCASLYRLADEQLQQPRILSNSIVLGFPYADVEEMGSSIIVVADGDRDLAQRSANELAAHLNARREEFVGQMISIASAIELAIESPKPVCLLDTGDNVGGGSPADATLLASAVLQRKLQPSFVMIHDPQSVERCVQQDIGSRIELEIGGKTDDLHGKPLRLTGTIRSMHSGDYRETKVRHGGWSEGSMGKCAVVDTQEGMTLLITSLRTPPFSLEPLRAAGLDPAAFDYLIAKGVHAPVAAYGEVCKTFIRVNTPGVTNADMTQLPFHHRRRPLFPFER